MSPGSCERLGVRAFTVNVIATERLCGSLIITFSDGRCGVYSSRLLYLELASARELHETHSLQTSETQKTNG